MGYFGWLVGLFNNNAILDMHEFNKEYIMYSGTCLQRPPR